jgi:hypothetical protein
LEVTSDEDGLFSFSNVAPGPFHLTISSPDLASQDFSGTIQPGEAYVTPLFMLVIPLRSQRCMLRDSRRRNWPTCRSRNKKSSGCSA